LGERGWMNGSSKKNPFQKSTKNDKKMKPDQLKYLLDRVRRLWYKTTINMVKQ
jgi:hypothetical protein